MKPTVRAVRPGARKPPRKAAYHHGDLRRVLIEGALQVIASQGVDVLSLRDVARAVGVSHAAPYHHFPDKSALLAAVAEEGFRAMHAEMLRGCAELPPLDHAARLKALGIAYVLFAAGHPAHFRVMFGGSKIGDWTRFPSLEEAGDATFGLMAEAVAGCVASNPRLAGQAQGVALAAWSSVHGLASLWVEGPLSKWPASQASIENLAELVTGLFVHSLESRPDAGTVSGSRTDRSR